MRFIERPFCERLGVPFAQELGAEGLLSPEAIAHPPVYSRARAVCVYEDGPARGLVHRLKYHDRLEAARPMGAWMARAGAEQALLAEANCLIPVPLHRTRLFARRFNQAAALAHAVWRESGVPVEALALARRKRTSPQVGLSKSQRALNLQGAFVVREEMGARIAGRRVVLIDDVDTSGATANAAAAPCGGPARPRSTRSPSRALSPSACEGVRERPYREKSEGKPMQPVTIYTTQYCPYCLAAKQLLRSKCRIRGNRRRRRPRGSGGDDAARRGAHERAANLHRCRPCRGLRRPA